MEDFSDIKERSKEGKITGSLISFLKSPTLRYLLLLGIMVAGVIYLVKQKPELIGLTKPENAPEVAKAEIDLLVDEISTIMLLPEDETPSLLTVTDLERLRDQKFYENAKNGDKVLVYRFARKAILYRPSERRIIEVGTVNVQETGDTAGVETEAEIEVDEGDTATQSAEISVTPTPSVTK
jgi:hypothetical protein